MFNDLLFLLGLSLLVTHQLDAIRGYEWRLFPPTMGMDDRLASSIFIALHIPLFAALFWALSSGAGALRTNLIIGLDIFFMFHVLLHLTFRKHPDHGFSSLFSWFLIYSAAVCGLLDLLLRWLY